MEDAVRNENRIEDLIVGHFDGTLNEQQEMQLARAMSASAESQQLFLSYMRMEGRLHSLGRDGFFHETEATAFSQAKQVPITTAEIVATAWRGRPRRRLLAVSSMFACAAVALMLLAGVAWPSTVSASDVLERAQQAAAELIDRTYRVTLFDSATQSQPKELTLNVRGGGCFLLRPTDDAFIMGSDGMEYWAAQQRRPVWVASESRLLARRLRRNLPGMWLFGIATSQNEPLLLDMTGLLSLIERRHDVELIDSRASNVHHVRGRLKNGRRKLPSNTPETIDLWADAKTGVGLRADVTWADGRQIRFELIDSKQLSNQWYHRSQHVPDREVRRFQDENRL
jgi:outer membrane lipoprotein-sorting protein